MDVLKNFLFPKIDFKRDIIRAKIWFQYGKRLLANNMTGQGDVRLCTMRCKLQQLKNGSIENENPTDAEVKKY